MKRLIVGDIHGCRAELDDLVARAGIEDKDEIIALGDLFDRGPDPRGVLRFLKERSNVRSILGNHERKHLRVQRGESAAAAPQLITRSLMGARYGEALDYMRCLPAALELDEAILVHGFWEPRLPLDAQQEPVLAGALEAEAYLAASYGPRWYEKYDGPKPLIAGHHDYLRESRPLVARGRVYAIDTGCCYGGALTGLVLPEFRVISVASRANHWGELRRRFALVPGRTQTRAAKLLSDDVLRGLARLIEGECDRVLCSLRRRAVDDRKPQERERLFAAEIGDGPYAALMRRALRGGLDVTTMRRALRTRSEIQSLLRRLNRPTTSEKDGRS